MANIQHVLLETLQNLSECDIKTFQWYLNNGIKEFRPIPKAQLENADRTDMVDIIVQCYKGNGAVDITLSILRKMNKNQQVEVLWTKLREGGDRCKELPELSVESAFKSAQGNIHSVLTKYKSNLKNMHKCIVEGMEQARTPLEHVYTELYIVEGERKLKGHEMWQTEQKYNPLFSYGRAITYDNIFTPTSICESNEEQKEKTIRTVLTKGVAGIGKTVSVQKFILNWVKGIANQDIDLIILLPFRELNLVKENQYSLQKLLIYCYPALETIMEYITTLKLILILDGLDESKLELNFDCENLSDTAKASRVDELLVNLIKGKLLPNAHVWITSRPAASDQIPPEYTQRVTEILGFSNSQIEEYLKKRISDQEQANKIIAHIKQSRTLYDMCRIPLFCQIGATLLQQNADTIPKSLTEMYTNLLLIQTGITQQKYETSRERDSKKLLESNRAKILKLAKLAFQQMTKGNTKFYEEDLKACNIDVTEPSLYSGIFNEMFMVEYGFYQRRVYTFVPLSFQEFLAAFYVFHCFVTKDIQDLQFFNPLYKEPSVDVRLETILKEAVNKALQSQTGHLDLFLRFLLGIVGP